MERRYALSLLGLGTDATSEEIERAYRAQCAELESRIQIAPTEALKSVYRDSLGKLEAARTAALPPAEPAPPPPPPVPPPAAAPPEAPPARAPEPPPGAAGAEPAAAGAISDAEAAIGFLEGRVLLDRYEVRRRLSIGPLSAVYAGYDRVARRDIAIKVLLPDLVQAAHARERYLTEARIASHLSHPNIVRIFDVQEEGPLLFITMELVEGQTLRAAIGEARRGGRPVPVRRVQLIAALLSEALRYAHRFTVHRNIKPENILFGTDGSIKLTDFAIGTLLAAERVRAGGAPESPYLAPEQREPGASVDQRADQYALAAVLYEALTGERPPAPGRLVLIRRAGVPAGLAGALQRGLQAVPEDRFPDMGAFAAALGEGASTLGDWRVWTAAGGALAAAVALTLVALRRGPQETPPPQPVEADVGRAATAAAEAEREATARVEAEVARDDALRATLSAARVATQAAADAQRVATARSQEAEARAVADARAAQAALDAAATRSAMELERANAEVRAQAERVATGRAVAEAERKATAQARREAERAATAKAVAEAARAATARAEAEAARVETAKAEARAVRTATAQARADAQRAATAAAQAEAERTAAARQQAEGERQATARAAAEAARAETAQAEAEKRRAKADIPSLGASVSSFRFFEKAQGEPVPEGEREFDTRFRASRARAIFWELGLTHPPSGQTKRFNIESVCYREDGSVFGEGRLSTYIDGKWSKSTHVYGWGFKEPGQWQPGTYAVEVFIDGKRIASGSFEVR